MIAESGSLLHGWLSIIMKQEGVVKNRSITRNVIVAWNHYYDILYMYKQEFVMVMVGKFEITPIAMIV